MEAIFASIKEDIPLIILAILACIEVVPIKISPLSWIGKRINKPILDKLDTVQQDLQEHVVDDMRTCILDFQQSCMEHKKHTHEAFTRVYKICDKYEEYIKTRNLKNNEIDAAIKYIRRIYDHCLDEGHFLVPNEKEEEHD